MSFRLVEQLVRLGKARRPVGQGLDRRGRSRPRPRVEGLEDRRLLANFLPGTAFAVKSFTLGATSAVKATGIAPGTDGNVYAVGGFTANPALGTFLFQIQPNGALNQLSGNATAQVPAVPDRVVAGPDNALWFTVPADKQIDRSDLTNVQAFSSVPATAATPSGPPLGITVGPDGALWYTEGNTPKIGRIDVATQAVTEYSLNAFQSGVEITLGPDNALWFTQPNSQIGRLFVVNGVPVASSFIIPTQGSIVPNPLKVAAQIVTDPANGDLYFTDKSGFIGQIAPNQNPQLQPTITEIAVPTAGGSPDGITVGSDGALWFTENGASQLGRLNISAGFSAANITEYALSQTTTPANLFVGPDQITTGPDGNLYFTNSGSPNIGEVVLTPAPSSTITFSTPPPVTANKGVPFTGQVVTFTDTNPFANFANYRVTIIWGDGTTSTGQVLPDPNLPQTFDVTGTHTYTAVTATSLPVAIQVTDVTTNTTATATTTATVSPAPLTATSVPFTPLEGQFFTGQIATFTDPDLTLAPGDFSATIDWGESNSANPQTSQAIIKSGGPGLYFVFGSHIYANVGGFNVSVTIDQGPSTTVNTSQPIAVADSTLIPVNQGLTPTIPVGNPVTSAIGPVATFLDLDKFAPSKFPAQPNFYTATIIYGMTRNPDGTTTLDEDTNATVQVDPLAANLIQVVPGSPHTFATIGPHTFTVQVTDQGGGMGVAQATVDVNPAPIVATAVNISGLHRGDLFNNVVATFTQANPLATASDFQAQIAWGDGHTSPGLVVNNSNGPGFAVFGSNTFAAQGTLQTTITITDKAGDSTAVNGQAVILPTPLTLTGTSPLTGLENTPLSGPLVTFSDADPFAMAGDYTAVIDWGDNTTSPGTVSSLGTAAFAVSGAHTYTSAGTFPIRVQIGTAGAAFAVQTQAIITAPPIVPITGQLDPTTDTGPSNSDGITADNLPRFTGTAAPGATVQLFVQSGGGAPVPLGQAGADGNGNWSITIGTPLADGSYTVIASATDANGNVSSLPTQILAHPLVIQTTVPTITDAELNASANTVLLTFHDADGNFNLASLTNKANYTVARITSSGFSGATVQSVSLAGTATDPVVTLHISSVGRNTRTRFVGLQLIVTTSRIDNLAGTAVDGAFTGSFPTGNGHPGSPFQGQFLTSGAGLTQAINTVVTIDTRGAAQHQGFIRSRTPRRRR